MIGIPRFFVIANTAPFEVRQWAGRNFGGLKHGSGPHVIHVQTFLEQTTSPGAVTCFGELLGNLANLKVVPFRTGCFQPLLEGP